ncbi:unnamed protein product [Didymodactylos carnosus]|uniref:MATH domain-containing protein n=1 Tax=Didymodactylos carnosus TaxID=1234261 RepID=A0A814FLD0_9BILA|nr:unnamed protein product [Didymodactylos carnosus]CAF1428992.1 unnamed protein product [Didymodactylos carnosus]CAF3755933.1 unnamed protein product [Didymodactylos carnosus]CAF4227398.1 unnamed protein product [Didymodactylos carnosus]
MNIASGIPKFFPIAMIQQHDSDYVRDDTMFIKIMVDFSNLPKMLLPFALNLHPGLPTHVQQQMIEQESQRRQDSMVTITSSTSPTVSQGTCG